MSGGNGFDLVCRIYGGCTSPEGVPISDLRRRTLGGHVDVRVLSGVLWHECCMLSCSSSWSCARHYAALIE
jgi:hypothetical protein